MTKLRLISGFLLSIVLLACWAAYAQEDPVCSGAPLPRLPVGGQARVLPGDANNVRDAASRGGALVGSIPSGEVFDVLAGPTCADGFNWWNVQYGDLTGWTAEGSGTDYWVEPYDASAPTATPAPTSAPTSTPVPQPVITFESPIEAVNVIEIGTQVRVINDDVTANTVTLTIRAAPGRSGSPVVQAQEGDLLTIIDGPQDADGLRWWQVETARGSQGWVVEGLRNAERNGAYERTLLPVCPAEGERSVYRVDDYIVTSAPDGSDPCVLDVVRLPSWRAFGYHVFGFDHQFIPSPDGQYALYVEQPVQNDTRNVPVLYRLRLDGSERLALIRGAAVDFAAWSPDGQRIAVGTGYQIGVMNADGSGYFTVTRGEGTRAWATWLPDNETLVYAEGERQQDAPIRYGFYRIHLREGGLEQIFPMTSPPEPFPRLSPDGTMLAVVSSISPSDPNDSLLQVFDVETGELIMETHTEFSMFVSGWLWTPDSSALVLFSFDGMLKTIPLDGGAPSEVEISEELGRPWNVTGWESDTVVRLSIYSEISDSTGELEVWAIDTTTGEAERLA